MDLYEIDDYRQLIEEKIKTYPQKGYGIQGKLAAAIGMHSSFLTSVLKGSRQLTPEHALGVTVFFELSPLEKEYFLELVHHDRAGTKELRQHHAEKLTALREKTKGLKDRAQPEKELSAQHKAFFYSDWRYSAIRMASTLPHMSASKIAKKLDIKIEAVHRILEFLLAQGLVIRDGEQIKRGPNFTRVRPNDPLVYRHHANWRQKAMENFGKEDQNNLNITAPFSLSKKDAAKIRKILQKNVEDVFSIVEPSEEEELWCFNLDWFRFDGET